MLRLGDIEIDRCELGQIDFDKKYTHASQCGQDTWKLARQMKRDAAQYNVASKEFLHEVYENGRCPYDLATKQDEKAQNTTAASDIRGAEAEDERVLAARV